MEMIANLQAVKPYKKKIRHRKPPEESFQHILSTPFNIKYLEYMRSIKEITNSNSQSLSTPFNLKYLEYTRSIKEITNSNSQS